MDKNFRGLSFVTTCMDDILVHSTDNENHILHLREVFKRLTDVGLTLRAENAPLGWEQCCIRDMCSPTLGHDP